MQVKTAANLSQASILKFIAEAIRLIPKIAANCNRQNKAIIAIRMYRSIKLNPKRRYDLSSEVAALGLTFSAKHTKAFLKISPQKS